ncbi:hypothetical protein MPSI1_003045 [Malassezia psittaci]|uniref:ABC transporter domain-containing protein n=1 Tax=Malassezia psittaci TaxID=1821823 RepID=A0AAF0FH05_9BASI|nr:hypothetical protein MPSI1_003045 [Malassezia psittaci]
MATDPVSASAYTEAAPSDADFRLPEHELASAIPQADFGYLKSNTTSATPWQNTDAGADTEQTTQGTGLSHGDAPYSSFASQSEGAEGRPAVQTSSSTQQESHGLAAALPSDAAPLVGQHHDFPVDKVPSSGSGSTRVGIDAMDPEGSAALSKRLGDEHDAARRQELESSGDVEKQTWGDDFTTDPFDADHKFSLEKFMRAQISEQQQRGQIARDMGVAFRNLNVTGWGTGAKYNTTVGSMLTSPIRALTEFRQIFKKHVRHILHDITGCVKPGEMLLVLGRPGSGSTTLLKSLCSYRDGYRSIEGDLLYEGFDWKSIQGPLRGEVVYAPEDDIHFATLSVKDTLDFAAASRAPRRQYRVVDGEKDTRRGYVQQTVEVIATILGLRHTYNTIVGDSVTRGVSGGERKRVSIGEALASHARILMFDNSSRGLDSSTAYEFGQALRVTTDVSRTATLSSIYQSGESLTNLFDKVVVLNNGYCVYFGPLKHAAEYFKSIGYLPHNRQTTADFLVSVTDPIGRRLNPDFKQIPLTPEEQAAAFRSSPIGRANEEEVNAYLASMQAESAQAKKEYVSDVRAQRTKRAREQSRYMLSWPQQIRLAIKRRAQIAWGDRMTALIMSAASLFQALIMGSVFFQMAKNSSGLFSRSGVIFFALLYNSFSAMAEIPSCYSQRPVVIRQQRFAMLHPSADALGNVLLDIPVRSFTITFFTVVLYFMTGLAYRADKFFIFYFTCLLLTFTMVSFFRALTAWTRSVSVATMVAGLVIIDSALYAGYAIPRPSMVIWWRWLSYCNPIAFGFEVLMMNEYRGESLPCAPGQMFPPYPDVPDANKVCPVSGARPGESVIDTENYAYLAYGYKWSSAHRNVGIVIGFFIFFVLLYMIGSEFQSDPAASGGVMVFKRGSVDRNQLDRAEAMAQNPGVPESTVEKQQDNEIVREQNQQAGELNNANYANGTSRDVNGIASGNTHVNENYNATGNSTIGNNAAYNNNANIYTPAAVNTSNDANPNASTGDNLQAQQKGHGILSVSDEIFSWEHINYDVMIKGNPRRLLNDVSGFVAPGKMTALMGESGAGKTTLLNVLAQRTDVGVVHGDLKVDGRPPPRSFQADTGYCQQQDVHLAQTTVREALQFSALLRQSRETPMEERLAYVEQVIELLEMESFAEAIVGEVAEGLNVEQRKRLTIGVELAAKPSLLLFLDEPTSGLDAQAAWSIVRFLKKLASEGQAILCTIHQPSGELFNQFDRLLLLQKGGKTVYFGELGQNSMTLVNYFEERSGVKCDEDANPAEYILDVIGAGATATTDKDWFQLYRESPLYTEMQQELQRINQRSGRAANISQEEHARLSREYAQPLSVQLKTCIYRVFVAYWRDPTYVLAKLFLNLFGGLFIGSSFWGQGQKVSSAALQNKLFATFMSLVLSTSLSQQLQPVFINYRTLFEAREKPSKLYSWPVMVTSLILVEIPWNILGGTIFWVPWYFMVRFGDEGTRAGYSWGLYMLFQLYYATFAQAVASIAANGMVASILFSTLFSFVIVFCGVVQPPSQMPTFWRSWMFHLSPFTYIVEGQLGNAIHDKPVICSEHELNTIIPPSGQTCDSYLQPLSYPLNVTPPAGSSSRGYYLSNADGTCGFCSMRNGEDYLAGNEMNAKYRYRDIGILCAYIAFNLLLVYAMYYLFRVHSWRKSGLKASKKKPEPSDEAEAKVGNQLDQSVARE